MSNLFDNYHSLMNMTVVTMIQNPNDYENVIFVDKNMENLITRNCGDNFQPIF